MPPHGGSRPSLQMRSLVTLGDVSVEWDRLVDLQPLPSPFLKSWWLNNAAGGKPEILCFFDGEKLVGGAAFEVDRIGRGRLGVDRVRCLGQGVLAPDHLDIICTPEVAGEVLDQTVEWLLRDGSRVVDLDGLSADGQLAGALRRHEISRLAAPFASLDGGPQEYLAGRPGKVRSTAKRGRNRLAKLGVDLAVTDGANRGEVERALDSLAELHDGRWSEQSRFLGAFDRFRAAALAGIPTGDVLVYELSGTEHGVVAIEVDLRAGNRVCFYQAGRRTEHDWRGCGTVLRAAIVEAVGSSGSTEYDLLRGDEPYKAEWATGQRILVRCRFGAGPTGRVAATAANLWTRVSPVGFALFVTCRDGLRRGLSRAPWSPRREPHNGRSG